MKSVFYFIFLTLFFQQASQCDLELSQMSIQKFEAPQDLPHEVVNDVIMTKDGAVWIATWSGGVVAMDGLNKTYFNEKNGLISNFVDDLEEDVHGRVWVGTSKGIDCIHDSKVFHCNTKDFHIAETVSAIEALSQGPVWFGDEDGQVYSWTPSDNSTLVEDGVWKKVYDFKNPEGQDVIKTASIQRIQQISENLLGIAVYGIGIVKVNNPDEFDQMTFDFTYCHDISLPSVRDMFIVSDHDLICGVYNNIDKFNGNPHNVEGHPLPSTLKCLAYAFDRLYVGTENGLYALVEKQGEKMNPWNEIKLDETDANYNIRCISFLPNNTVWIGTSTGIFRFSPTTFTEYKGSSKRIFGDSLAQNNRHELFVFDNQSNLLQLKNDDWQIVEKLNVGIDEGNFYSKAGMWANNQYLFVAADFQSEIDLVSGEIVDQYVMPYSSWGGIRKIQLNDQNHLFFATDQGIIEKNNNKYIKRTDLTGNEKVDAYSLLKISENEYWIGGKGQIFHYVGGSSKTVDLPEGFALDNSMVLDILQLDSGEIWFAAAGIGILRYQENTWLIENYSTGMELLDVNVLFQGSDGVIWAGDKNYGVMTYQGSRWIKYRSRCGLPSGAIANIVEDANHNIWIGVVDKGIYQYKPDPFPPTIHIDATSGQFLPNEQGVFVFEGQDRWNVTKKDELVYSWRVIEANAKETVVNWTPYSKNTFALLPHLTPGDYRFEVQSQDHHRNTSPIPAAKPFVVIPYFWKTLSFMIPVFLSAVFAIISLWMWRNQYVVRLRRERNQFLDFCAAAKIGILLLSRNLKILFANTSVATILGYESEEDMKNDPHAFDWLKTRDFQRFIQTIMECKKASPTLIDGKNFKTGAHFSILAYGLLKQNDLEIMVLDFTKQKELEKQIVMTSNREKQRIGKELHDSVLQDLAGVSIMGQIQIKKLQMEKGLKLEELESLINFIDRIRLQAREIAKGLSPTFFGQLGLQSSIPLIIKNIKEIYGIECAFDNKTRRKITNEYVSTNLYYIAQEALYNSVKHSRAGAIKISLEENQNFVVMTIQDDGIGIDPHHPNGGMGLSIIRYRASLIHADIQIENDPKGGTIVSCMIPMDQIV